MSRRALVIPSLGSSVLTQSDIFASGPSPVPLGLKLSVSGRVSGRSEYGTATGTSGSFSA